MLTQGSSCPGAKLCNKMNWLVAVVPILAYAAGVSHEPASRYSLQNSSSASTISTVGGPSTNFYYTDDSNICYGSTVGKRFSFHQAEDDAYVVSWGKSPHTAVSGGCRMTFSSYSDYGMNMTFIGNNSFNYIKSRGVTLSLYAGSSQLGTLLVCSFSIIILRFCVLQLCMLWSMVVFSFHSFLLPGWP